MVGRAQRSFAFDPRLSKFWVSGFDNTQRANTPLIYKGNYLHGSGTRIRMIIRIKGIFLNEVALRSLSNLEAELCMRWDIELLFLASTKPIYGDFHK